MPFPSRNFAQKADILAKLTGSTMSVFGSASFLKSVPSLEQAPTSVGEIAFAGRSNSGKSSAINALFGRRLAHVSKAPGRTRLINYYALGTERFIVDLPGYGYARVPDSVRAPWEELLGSYLRTRAALRGLAVVMDVRHPVTDLDRRLLEWFRPAGKPVHVLLTKADKLSREAARKILRQVETDIAALLPDASVQLFSSLGKMGLEEAATVFRRWLDLTEDPAKMKTPGKNRGSENKSPRAKRGNQPGAKCLKV
jgi:GTP-binding protein